MIIHRTFLFLSAWAFVCSLHAQNDLPDSLQKKFEGFPQDSNYVIRLNALAGDLLKTNPQATRSIASHTMDVASRIKFIRGYARSLIVIGNSYWYEGVYEFAQNYYLLAARQYQSIGDSIGLGRTYNNIGEVYKKLNEYDKALAYHLKAIAFKKKDTLTHALTLYNIGELYIHMNQLSEARRFIDQSLAFAIAGNNKRVIAYDYWSLGAIRKKEGNFPEALGFYSKAEKLWSEIGETRSLIQTYQDVAEIFREQRQYDRAESYLMHAMNLATQIKVPDLQVINYQRISRLDSMRGYYSRALYYLSKYNSLKDSVYTLSKAEQIARLQTVYETEVRDAENRKLRSEKEIQDLQLHNQYIILTAITTGLVLAAVLAWFLYRQRKKILLQKEAIEMQAVALLKLNEELQRLNKNLEDRIEERTSQIILQNQRITEYTFINAHKLRAPVASILGLINLLQQVAPEEKESILAHLKTCGEQLDSIIREISRNLEGALVPERKQE